MIEKDTGIFETNGKNDNIYMCGDIHGDYQCLIHCLVDLCGVCEISRVFNDKEFGTPNREYLSWIPGSNSVVVFCGDLIHRKRYPDNVLDDECSDVFIIKMLLRLKAEAKSNGGDIIIIAGNHEILNILEPDNNSYTSNKNLVKNEQYFNSSKFVNEYIANSYAWIKINNILVAHGGLCSDYLRYLDNTNIFDDKIYSDEEQIGGLGLDLSNGDGIVAFVNNKYREFFTHLNKLDTEKDVIGYNLFVKYDVTSKNKLNVFWCREWGFSGIDCDKFKKLLEKVGCSKMIIAHCPQFVSPDYPKMINFECIDVNASEDIESFNIARIDLGMSRCFDYNKEDNFLYYLSNNFNRKMSVLKLNIDSNNNIIFNIQSIVTKQLSCIQYLLLKYGLTREKWLEYKMDSNWLGFEYLTKILGSNNIKSLQNKICSCGSGSGSGSRSENGNSCGKLNIVSSSNTNYNKKYAKFNKKTNSNSNGESYKKAYVENLSNGKNVEETILCLLSPITNSDLELDSIKQFRENLK